MAVGRSLWLDATRWSNRALANAVTVRSLGISLYRCIASLNRVLPPPRILLNGPSKSGTHLLSDCLALLPKTMFSGRHFALSEFAEVTGSTDPGSGDQSPPCYPSLDINRLHRFLRGCPQGMYVTTHARFHPDLAATLDELAFRQLLLLRDPRDIVVAFTRYVMSRPRHQRHAHYTKAFSTEHERIMGTIKGVPEEPDPLINIGDRMRAYLPWLDDPRTLACRYEDLIGPLGRGTRQKQLSTIQEIALFLHRPLSAARTELIADKMYSKNSLTYRKGAIGDWQQHFSQAHREAFKDSAQDVLIALGYESDDRW